MKSKIVKGILFTCLMVLMCACNTKNGNANGEEIDKEQILKEIQAKENLFAKMYNAGEIKNIGYYAEEAISFSQNRRPLVGREAIREYLVEGLDSISSTNKISFETIEIFVSNDGNQVVGVGSYEVFDSSNTIINSGNYMSLFEKRDGKYVSLRDMSVSNMEFED